MVHDSWNTAQIVGGGHVVQAAFTYVAYDDNQQATTTCVTSQTVLLGDLVPADAPMPPGTERSDTATLSFIATVIPKP